LMRPHIAQVSGIIFNHDPKGHFDLLPSLFRLGVITPPRRPFTH
jgi:hypothetical protein